MAHHRYKTREELVATPGVVVDTVSFGKGYADYRYGDQSVLVDIAKNNILGRKVEVGKDQYFGDWFCVFVPDEIVSSTPKESVKYGAPGLVTSPFNRDENCYLNMDVPKPVKSSASDEELRYKCIKEAQRFFQEGCHSPELLIKAAEKIYKYIKQ